MKRVPVALVEVFGMVSEHEIIAIRMCKERLHRIRGRCSSALP